MEKKYEYRIEDLRSGLLETFPGPLLEASRGSGSITESDLTMAMDFLDAHTRLGKTDWTQNLVKFVALKESLGAIRYDSKTSFNFPQNTWAAKRLQKRKAPLDFPEGPMEKLLSECPDLLEEMLLADGPSGGNYGKAMEIYQEIYRESDCVHDSDYPILHRLAVAIALVHATPVAQTNPVESIPGEDPPEEFVDPVRRYLNYEVAYMEGELDPAFDTLTTWELRFVIDGDETDEVAAWGRKTLRNGYPEHVLSCTGSCNNTFLYAKIVKTDIPHGSARVKFDDPKHHKYQNILRNGGVCGRRAFFGRFILRSFGIPTTARPSRGHAALIHWMPHSGEWVVNLGPTWGKGWTKTRYGKDLNFQATLRARLHENEYRRVKLAQWIGDLFDERRVYGIYDETGRVGLWYRLSLKVQDSILSSDQKPPPRKRSQMRVATIAENADKLASSAGSSCCWVKDRGRAMLRLPASEFANPRSTKDVKVVKGFGVDENCSDATPMGNNRQIYLPSFQPQGSTIMRGGSWKTGPEDQCNSGNRLLSGGYGKYEDWGFRVAISSDEDDNEGLSPEPKIELVLGGGDTAITMEFVYIPPEKFVMGGKNNTDGRFACVELPHHSVELTKGFYMGKYPVTQSQYMAAKGKKNPSKSTKGPKCPVDNVGLDDALEFCRLASEDTGSDVRLPTEAEWEYASRGNTCGMSADPQCFFGNDLSLIDHYSWYKDNSGGKSHPVGLKKPNPFGLYDIYGNVWERVSDTYHKDYYSQGKGSVMVDPTGPSQGVKSRFKYEIKNVPEAGKYFLTAKVCTMNVHQHLKVSPCNGVGEEAVLELPYTLGEWKDSESVTLELKKGDNILTFWRDAPPQYGISIKEFILTKAN